MAGLALHALAVGNETAAFTAFMVAAMTIVVVMTLLVLAIGRAQANVIRTMKSSTQSIKRWGGFVLIVVGIWLIILSLFADTFAQILAG